MPASKAEIDSIPASLIRQHVFCPRIPFYNEVLAINPGNRPWQQQGVEYHQRQAMLVKRRRLHRFGLDKAEIKNNLPLRSLKLGIHGICDALCITGQEICPLEFKLHQTRAPQRGHILQLGAYALMAEEQFRLPCKRMFILYGGRGQTAAIAFNDKIRVSVLRNITEIKNNLYKPLLPASSATVAQCGQCEYLNFCADRSEE